MTLRDGEHVEEQEIIEFCREHLARFKAPAAVEFGALPKTSTGKVQKYVLRNREWAGREHAHQLTSMLACRGRDARGAGHARQ